MKKKPTAKQIAARKLFAQRAKAGLFKRKIARARKNAGVVRMSETEAKKYTGKIKGLASIGSSAPKGKQRQTSGKGRATKRGATKGLFRSFRIGRAAGRGVKKGALAVGRTARGTARG